MLNTRGNSCRSQKVANTLNTILRICVLITWIVFAEQALEIFISTPRAYAEESQKQALPKQFALALRNKHNLKIREILYLQKDFGNPDSALQTLDRIFDAIKKKIKPKSQYNKEEAIEALKAIGDVLEKEGNFEYRENNLLIEGLEKQKNGKRYIDCDDYSSIYLAAAGGLGLFLEPVYAPKHVFLRYRSDDCMDFYWEPTLASEKDFCFYKDWLNITEASGYPKVLNEKEFEAIQFNNIGVAWYEKGNYEKAIGYFKKAVNSNPDLGEAFNNLGVAYAKQGDYSKAIDCYKKATLNNPNYATPFNNTGVAFYKLGYLEKAIKYFEKAIKADPKYYKAYNYKFVALVKKGEQKKALKFLERIRELK